MYGRTADRAFHRFLVGGCKEGVYHWAFYRMVPPLLGAEVLVSYTLAGRALYLQSTAAGVFTGLCASLAGIELGMVLGCLEVDLFAAGS
jgi:hypothetical protein